MKRAAVSIQVIGWRFGAVAAATAILGCSTGARIGVLSEPPAQSAQPDERRLLFENPLDRPFEAYINGRGPYRLGFDTGQSLPVLLNPDLTQRLDLPVVHRTTASDGSPQNAQRVDVARIRNFELGGMSFKDVPTLVMDHSAGERVDTVGTVGFPLFAGKLLTLDYPRNLLTVETGRLPRPDGREVLQYDAPQGLPVVRIWVGAESVRALVDSGSDAGLVLPLEMAARLPLAGPLEPAGRLATLFNVIELQRARLNGSVWIGTVELRDPVLTFADHFEEANLGRAVLKNLRVSFDHQNKRVHFERPELAPEQPTGNTDPEVSPPDPAPNSKPADGGR